MLLWKGDEAKLGLCRWVHGGKYHGGADFAEHSTTFTFSVGMYFFR